LTDLEFRKFKTCLIDHDFVEFVRAIRALYPLLPHVWSFARPRYTIINESAPRRTSRSRGVGGYTGESRSRNDSADNPNGQLAVEYINRSVEDDSSIPQNQLVTMLQNMILDSTICNQIHELLISNQIGGEELTVETA
jgi:hypothetical protein